MANIWCGYQLPAVPSTLTTLQGDASGFPGLHLVVDFFFKIEPSKAKLMKQLSFLYEEAIILP